jgi:hypothetical protein
MRLHLSVGMLGYPKLGAQIWFTGVPDQKNAATAGFTGNVKMSLGGIIS